MTKETETVVETLRWDDDTCTVISFIHSAAAAVHRRDATLLGRQVEVGMAIAEALRGSTVHGTVLRHEEVVGRVLAQLAPPPVEESTEMLQAA